jgi:hypothetical protein
VPYSLWHAEDFFHPEKSWRLRPGLNPRTWVLEGSTLPLDHQNRFFQHITMTELKNVKFQCAVSNTYFTLSPRNDKLSCTHNQFFSPSSYFCHVLMVNSHTMWLSWCTLLFLSTKKSVKVQSSEQEQWHISLSSNSFSSQAWKTVYRSSRSFKPIYLRCQLFSYWVQVSNEATFLMCKGVETVNTMIWTHATVSNTTKRQSVNCNTKSSLTAFNYFLWCRFD